MSALEIMGLCLSILGAIVGFLIYEISKLNKHINVLENNLDCLFTIVKVMSKGKKVTIMENSEGE